MTPPTAHEAQQVRLEHRPGQDRSCGCGRWICTYCLDGWPCGAEQWVRSAGVPPITISAYPGYSGR